jgi:hypothetical protein
MGNMKNKFLKLIIVSLTLLVSDSAFAYTLGANQNFNVNGPGNGLTFSFSGQSGAQAGRIYNIIFGTAGTGTLGNISNNRFDAVAFNVLLSSATITENVNGQSVAVAGNLTGALNINYNNVNVNLGANQAAAVGGVSTGTANFTMTGTLNGQSVQMNTSAMMPQYMDFALNQHGSTYNNTINAFSNGNLNFAMNIDGLTSQAHTWLKGNSDIAFNGINSNFNFGGDLHTGIAPGTTQVPEPATMGLLFSGLIGGAISRRKTKSV